MTKHVIDLGEQPSNAAEACRAVADRYGGTMALVLRQAADSIEGKGKRYVVLDVDELGFTSATPAALVRQATASRATLSDNAMRLLDVVADQLDALTPPRPEEPKALLAHVRCSTDEEWVRYALDSHCTHPWARLGPVGLDLTETVNWRELNNVDGVVEVLSPGVGGDV